MIPSSRRGGCSNKRLLNILKNENWDEAQSLLASVSNADIVEDDLEEMVRACDSSGQIPLHIAIWKRAPADLILSLIEADETTITRKTKNQSTPLHFATFYAAPFDVIETLLRKYPLALDEINEFGVTPRTYDLCKLDDRAKELLMKPTSFWIDAFVKDAIEEKARFRKKLSRVEADNAVLQKNAAFAAETLDRCRREEEVASRKAADLERKLSATEAEASKLRRKLSDCAQGASDGGKRESVDSPETQPSARSETDLERRIQYLEEKLSDAIQALDKKIAIANDQYVDEGWVITGADI